MLSHMCQSSLMRGGREERESRFTGERGSEYAWSEKEHMLKGDNMADT